MAASAVKGDRPLDCLGPASAEGFGGARRIAAGAKAAEHVEVRSSHRHRRPGPESCGDHRTLTWPPRRGAALFRRCTVGELPLLAPLPTFLSRVDRPRRNELEVAGLERRRAACPRLDTPASPRAYRRAPRPGASAWMSSSSPDRSLHAHLDDLASGRAEIVPLQDLYG